MLFGGKYWLFGIVPVMMYSMPAWFLLKEMPTVSRFTFTTVKGMKLSMSDWLTRKLLLMHTPLTTM